MKKEGTEEGNEFDDGNRRTGTRMLLERDE